MAAYPSLPAASSNTHIRVLERSMLVSGSNTNIWMQKEHQLYPTVNNNLTQDPVKIEILFEEPIYTSVLKC